MNFHPPEFPPRWANAWGDDHYGLYADLIVDNEKMVTQRFRWIAAGEFIMGSPADEPERSDREEQHKVRLTQGYWLGDTTVTQALWQAVMSDNPSHFKAMENPVENVNWDDTQEFISRLNETLVTYSGSPIFRLPTEAEWEHACRAGTTTPFSFGENITSEQVNYDGNSPYNKGEKGLYREKTVAVKSLPINSWGLYEMHGNVYEWCADAWQERLGKAAVVDPCCQSDDKDARRVLRGSSWGHYGRGVRSAFRYRSTLDDRGIGIGFRLCLGHVN